MIPMVGWLRLLILAASVPIASYVLARDVCLILPDSVSEASFRQLRVWLLWGLSFHLKPIEGNQGLVEEA